jgi:ATP-binding cassette subfamily B protein
MHNFPLYKQFDQMDCGPTCLRMISKHYGKSYSLQKLRRYSYITREGVSLLGINEAAESIGFRTIGVKISFEKLTKDAPLPCIVHWNQNHFAVVYKIRKNKVFVADPAGGFITYSTEEFKKSWLSTVNNGQQTGVALLLEPSPSFYEQDVKIEGTRKKSFSQLFKYLKNYRKFIIQLFIGLLLGSLLQLILPFLTQSIVDIGINTRNVNFIYLILIGQLMLFFSRMSVDFIRRWILLHLSTRISIAIVSDFLIKLLKLPLSFFDSKMVGDLLQRIDDHSRVERFLSSSSLNILFSFFNLLVFGIVLAVYNLSIFFVFFTFSAVYVGYILVFMKKRAELDYKRFSQLSGNQNNLIQMIYGMPEIKLNNCETQKRWDWERIQAKIFKLNVAGMKLQQYQDAGNFFINELKNILITFMAAMAVINGQMTLGMMLAVQYIIGSLNGPINDFISFSRDWQDARISLDRIGEIHALEDESDEIKDDSQRVSVMPESGTIIIKNLSFQYEGPHSPKVIEDLDLIVPEGKITAIVGSSGSGKTTLMKLLLKFYRPIQGEVQLGGVGLQYISNKEWRKRCGVVMQDGYIFSDTIARNISLSDETIDHKRLLHAVKIANIKDHIESLPLGYNTKIGTNGSGLSQGQKQRLLIARAVYRNPEFIFFDEATSALDSNNEKRIMENLNEFFRGRTVLVIAHRLSTVKNADQIVVLEKGKIVEAGGHEELVHSRGLYYELVKNQLELGN